MGTINLEDVRAYEIDDETVCRDCMSDEDRKYVRENLSKLLEGGFWYDKDIDDSEGELHYCDRCNKPL